MAQVVGVSVTGADGLEGVHHWHRPFVRAHLVRANTGEYLYVSGVSEPVSCSASTRVCQVEHARQATPQWKETLRLYADFALCLRPEENVAVLFEIYEHRADQGSWVSSKDDIIAWAFLKLVGRLGAPHTGKPQRLQLYKPGLPAKGKSTRVVDLQPSRPNQPLAGAWLADPVREPLRGSLRVSIQPVAPLPPELLLPPAELKPMAPPATGILAAAAQFKPVWSRSLDEPCSVPDAVHARLPSGTGGCLALQFSRSGMFLAAAVSDRGQYPIRVFQLAGLGNVGIAPVAPLGELLGHANVVYDLCWSGNDSMLLSASSDATACVWDLAAPPSAPSLRLQHPCFVYCARFHPPKGAPTTAITGAYDGVLRVWTLATRQCTEFLGHSSSINAIELDSSGVKMYTADSRGAVKVWISIEAGWRLLHSFSCHDMQESPVMSLRCHPLVSRLLVHVRDSVIRSVDLQSYSVVQRYPGAVNNYIRVRSCFSPCGSLVVSGSEDGCPRSWSADQGMLLRRLDSIGTPVHDVAFHPRDNILAVCSFAPNQPILLLRARPTAHRPTLAPLPIAPSHLLSSTLFSSTLAPPMLESTRLLQDSRMGPFEHNSSLTFDFMQPSVRQRPTPSATGPPTLSLPGGTLPRPLVMAEADELHAAYEQHVAALEQRGQAAAHPFGIATPLRPD